MTEVSPPPGLDVAPPQLVSYAVPRTPENCSIVRGVSSCVLDEDASGGFVVVVVSDSPSGGVDSATGGPTLPATDSGTDSAEPSAGYAWIAVVGVLVLSGLAFLGAARLRRG